MARIDRLKKIKFQHLKPQKATITSTWRQVKYIESAQSTLNALVNDDIESLVDSDMPVEFLGASLDWAAGESNDTIVKIRKNDIYVVQDLTKKNIKEQGFTTTPNLGVGYLGTSYYGGAL